MATNELNPDHRQEFYPQLSPEQQEQHKSAYNLAWYANSNFDMAIESAMAVEAEIDGYPIETSEARLHDIKSDFDVDIADFERYKKMAELLMPPREAYYPLQDNATVEATDQFGKAEQKQGIKNKDIVEIVKDTRVVLHSPVTNLLYGFRLEQDPTGEQIHVYELELEWGLLDEDRDLAELELGVVAYQTLKRNSIDTVNDLLVRTESQIAALPNLGKKTTTEIINRLTDRGFKLKPEEAAKATEASKSPPTHETMPDNMLIKELRLYGQTHNSLRRAGIQTVGDLVSNTEEEIKSIPSLSPKDFGEIYAKLHERGWDLTTQKDRVNKAFELRAALLSAGTDEDIRKNILKEQASMSVKSLTGTVGLSMILMSLESRMGVKTVGELMSLSRSQLIYTSSPDGRLFMQKIDELGLPFFGIGH